MLVDQLRMPRIRILLLLLWYYSITKVGGVDTNEKINEPPLETQNKHAADKWGHLRKFNDSKNGNSPNTGHELKRIKTEKAGIKTKREVDNLYENMDATEKKKRAEKKRRKVGGDYLDVIDTEDSKYIKHLASLISKYKGKYVQYGFTVGRAEDLIDLDMVRRCMTPIEIPKHFSPWLGKRGATQDAMQKRCLDTLVQPVEYRPSPHVSADGRYLKPFRPWGGKRDNEDIKKTNFGAWGGKRNIEIPLNDLYTRDDNSPVIDSPFMEREPKDAKFGAWGGKRALEYLLPAYSSDDTSPSIYSFANMERKPKDAKFSAWGGKRDMEDLLDLELPMQQKENSERQTKKAKFNAWGGKRNLMSLINTHPFGEMLLPSDPGLLEYDSDFPNTISLAKNRIRVQSLGASFQGSEIPFGYEAESEYKTNKGNNKHKREFSAWGGKRSQIQENQINPEAHRNLGEWDGKGEQDFFPETINDTEINIKESNN